MSDAWKPQGEAETLEHGTTLQYLRGPHKLGAHDVSLRGLWKLRVLPDSTTSGRGRSDAIRQAVAVFGGHDDPMATFAGVVGALVMIGATNLEVDGEPLIQQPTGKWMVLLEDNGRVEARYVKGAERW